jgi:proliferating cell nuclear antigen
VSSGEVLFDLDGIYISIMDTSQICLIDAYMDMKNFNKYNIDKPYKIGMNFGNFHDVLKLSKSNNMELLYSQEKNDKIMVKIKENENKIIEFDMNLFNISQDELKIPEVEYHTTVSIDASDFLKTIKDMATFGEKCVFLVRKTSLSIEVSGDAGKCKIVMENNDIEFSSEQEEVRSMFNIKYIIMFAKASLSGMILLKFGHDNVPFCFENKLEYGYVRFYLGELLED